MPEYYLELHYNCCLSYPLQFITYWPSYNSTLSGRTWDTDNVVKYTRNWKINMRNYFTREFINVGLPSNEYACLARLNVATHFVTWLWVEDHSVNCLIWPRSGKPEFSSYRFRDLNLWKVYIFPTRTAFHWILTASKHVSNQLYKLRGISGSHGDENQDDNLLGCSNRNWPD
jgi:hypothetical protein